MASIMLRIGILFAVLGFGSFILEQFNYEFTLISWASDMQPTFGIVLGLAGVALIAGSLVLGRAKAKPQPQQFGQQPPAPGVPQGGYPGRQYPAQAPQQQYPNQQYPQQPQR